MTSYCLDVVMFISEVKKYPEIWDLNSEDNRFKSKKQQAWSQIARVLIPDFDEMSGHEMADLYRKLQGKWRNIRDSYVRHVRRRYGKKSYLYAEHLTFLNNLYKQKTQSGSEEECDNEENSDDDETLKKIGFNGKFVIDNTTVWPSDADDSSPKDNLKRKRPGKEDIALEFVDTPFPGANSSYPTNSEDEDRSFFESLLPAVRLFNIDQKLEFRSQILSLIKNIRSANDTRTYIKIDPSNAFD